MDKNFRETGENRCPRCDAARLKIWQELTDDEKLLATKMPLSAEFTPDERKRHLFCPRCWFEQTLQQANI